MVMSCNNQDAGYKASSQVLLCSAAKHSRYGSQLTVALLFEVLRWERLRIHRVAEESHVAPLRVGSFVAYEEWQGKNENAKQWRQSAKNRARSQPRAHESALTLMAVLKDQKK
jgi:hypothetical protein